VVKGAWTSIWVTREQLHRHRLFSSVFSDLFSEVAGKASMAPRFTTTMRCPLQVLLAIQAYSRQNGLRAS